MTDYIQTIIEQYANTSNEDIRRTALKTLTGVDDTGISNLAERATVADVENTVSGPGTPEERIASADNTMKLSAQDEVAAAEVGVINSLADQEPDPERISLLRTNINDYVADQKRKTLIAQQALAERQQEIEQAKLDRVSGFEGIAKTVAFKAAGAAEAVLDIPTLFVPFSHILQTGEALKRMEEVFVQLDPTTSLQPGPGTLEGVSAMNQSMLSQIGIKPKAGDVLKLMQPEERIARLQALAKQRLSPDDFGKFVRQSVSIVRDTAGLVGENVLIEDTLSDKLLKGLAYNVDPDTSENFWTPLVAVFDAVAAKGLIGAGVRTVGSAADIMASLKSLDGLADSMAYTFEGAHSLANMVSGTPMPAAAIDDPAKIVGKLFLPSVEVVQKGSLSKFRPPDGTTSISESFLSAADKESFVKKLKTAWGKSLKTHLNQSFFISKPDGVESVIRAGNQAGAPYVRAESAQRAAAKTGLPYTIVESSDGRGFYAEFRTQHPYQYEDIGRYQEDMVKQWGQGRGLGVSSTFTAHIDNILKQAEVSFARSVSKYAQWDNPLRKLSNKKQIEVKSALEESRRSGRWIGRDELKGREKWDDDMWVAYNGQRRISDANYINSNLDARQYLKEQLYATWSRHGIYTFAKPLGRSHAEALVKTDGKAIDMIEGKSVALKDVDVNEYQVYSFWEPTKQGYVAGIAKNGSKPRFKPIPQQVLRYQPGWLNGRRYEAPVFIQEFDATTGVWRTKYTAPSLKSAKEWVGLENGSSGAENYRWKYANEVLGNEGTSADWAMRRMEGRFITSSRKPEELTDIEGYETLTPLDEALNNQLVTTALQESYGVATNAARRAFNETYGRALGVSFDDAGFPAMPATEDMIKLWREAKAIHSHFRLINGLGKAQQGWLADFKREAAEAFLSGRDWNLPGLPIGKMLQSAGLNLYGVKNTTIRGLRSAVYNMYIALAPNRQIVLQTSMIPTYMAIPHARNYMLSGRAFGDVHMLLTADDVEGLKVMAGAYNRDWREMQVLSKWYEQSVGHLVDTHLFQSTAFGSQGVVSNRFLRGGATVIQKSKQLGFEKGIQIDMASAWMVNINDIMKTNKLKASELTIEHVRAATNKAMQMTGNINRGDPLFSSYGTLGLFMQFQSHPIKMANRIMGAVTNNKIGEKFGVVMGSENFLTGAEQRRLVLYSLMSFGADTLRASGTVEWANQKFLNGELPEEAKLLTQEGLLVGGLQWALWGLTGEQKKFKWSAAFNPYSSSAAYIAVPAELLKAVSEMVVSDDPVSLGTLQEALSSAPTLGLLGRAGGIVHKGVSMMGFPTAEWDESVAKTAIDAFRLIPIVDDTLRAYLIMRTGMIHDKDGNPIRESVQQDLVSAFLGGAKSYSDEAYTEIMKDVTNNFDFGNTDYDFVRKQVRKDWATINALVTNPLTADKDIRRALDLMEIRTNQLMADGLLEPEAVQAYQQEMVSQWEKSQLSKQTDRFDAIVNQAISGTLPLVSVYDRLSRVEGWDKRDEHLAILKKLIEGQEELRESYNEEDE